MTDPNNDELILFEDEATSPRRALNHWPVLVIDDDDEVHAATRFALADQPILGRNLELVHAHSAAEARAILATRRDFAVILLDVVMETDDAGLALVGHIRETLGMWECRIILRTGQPGYAPELTVFNNYDINDYRTKAELTRTRLITAITAALRSFDQIRTIAENRRGLELIVKAVADLMEQHALTQFAEGVLTQMTALLKLPLDGIVCAQRGSPFDEDRDRLYIVGAAGKLAPLIAAPLDELDDYRVRQSIEQTIESGQHQFGLDHTTLYLRGAEQEGAVYLDTGCPLSEADRQLVEVFTANISACFSNLNFMEKLNFAAYHDSLTHLSNRSNFIVQLEHALRDPTPGQVAVLIDIDHFADINDGLGHDIGNELLVAVATRLEEALYGDCRLARIGADVFGVLGKESLLGPDTLTRLFSTPFEVGEHLLPVNVKLGYCRLEDGGGSGFNLLKRANIALNGAKKHLSADFDYFSCDMEEHTRWRLDLIRQLKHDFHAEKLAVWYQPQVAIHTGEVVGVEALLRWPSSDSGFVQPPSVFVPLAEYSGLIVEIGEWVLREACTAYHTLSSLQESSLRIAVNVSMPQFRTGNLTERVAMLLGSSRVPPSALELEITESIAMDEPKTVIAALEGLRALGISVAIDDFGTGYSSLAQLRALPIDRLKIDRAFVDEIRDGRGGLFAETIVTLGKKLGLRLIAEGVETPEQAGFLRALGCGEAQGFFYARPMPLEELSHWLAARQVRQ
ncbi:putative bifunctional diguanylate cyclase/phosphodiesterase [Chitiniphilus eburneus]|uniref:EAL domain-containing protein n=1 Tax=Chitiniphilus eburneus TaxID=2571148 RepID=A0A4U0QC31_9NEIS|nr:EAL domain-containing protein [Chitiniphilus eburneus]TJZ78846.1 EAL domain-containing protein [Chitiniphilus eburneus]